MSERLRVAVAGNPKATLTDWEEVKVGVGARTIDFAGQERFVIAAVNNASKLVAVDTATFQVVAQIPVDSYPVGLGVSPDETQLFVTSQGKKGGGGNSVGVYAIEYAE